MGLVRGPMVLMTCWNTNTYYSSVAHNHTAFSPWFTRCLPRAAFPARSSKWQAPPPSMPLPLLSLIFVQSRSTTARCAFADVLELCIFSLECKPDEGGILQLMLCPEAPKMLGGYIHGWVGWPPFLTLKVSWGLFTWCVFYTWVVIGLSLLRLSLLNAARNFCPLLNASHTSAESLQWGFSSL